MLRNVTSLQQGDQVVTRREADVGPALVEAVGIGGGTKFELSVAQPVLGSEQVPLRRCRVAEVDGLGGHDAAASAKLGRTVRLLCRAEEVDSFTGHPSMWHGTWTNSVVLCAAWAGGQSPWNWEARGVEPPEPAAPMSGR
ncbi:hypothetical protein ACFXJO_03130 [Streptomyces lavendulae]|uniref:hypothetical protein n=1 Tax=Streptomyces lavendulae TaxID=1914 RepID=UPI0036C2D27C